MPDKNRRPAHNLRKILSHDFVFGFLSLFAFILAYHALIPTLPIFFARLGSTDYQIGILIGVFGFSSLFFRLVVGGALLRYSEKTIMMFGAVLFLITFAASLVLRPFWPFFAVRFLQGVAFACVDTAALAFVVKVTSPARRAQAISYFVLAPPFSQAIAPSIGMSVINHYSFNILFSICFLLALSSFLFSSRLRDRKPPVTEQPSPGKTSFFFSREVVVPSITAFLQNFVWGGVITFLPLYALQCNIANPGLFFTANATMLIAGRAFGGRLLDTVNKERLILMVFATSVLAMIVIFFTRSLPMLVLVGLIWGTGGAFIFPASMSYALDYAGSSDGTTVGTFRALSDLGLALGPMIMGIIVPFTGYRYMFLCLAAVALANICYFNFYVRKKARKSKMPPLQLLNQK